MGRRSPRPASLALQSALRRVAPRTALGVAQSVWREAVGEAIAAAAEPVAEREGVLTVHCESATWAQELSMMESELLASLHKQLGDASPKSLKFLVGQPT
jgi:predicted nucleic acid-binding Zn ribbon protein